ncbi:MAG: hypothetical protein A2289_12255 [Deltaproteobacteria bacterium RIFOXYA12_FULL_58_15]|nr:MAG: hypothetical protein A2289_12255 [Deltaproteobacteria bacterium RIFOXYA12_FULL_58_15]OGR07370.1 MAG: hypothetical protein A2341_27000 [Deltaproteobacteria bacterium RIFOXYB12_FULL_58_9]
MAVSACVALGVACAHTIPPAPVTLFVDSPAFAAVKNHAHGVLARDLDGDGLTDHVTAEKIESGWIAAFHHHQRDEKGDRWQRICESVVVLGEEIDDFRWVEMDDGPLLLLVVNAENPDEIVQSLLLMDPSSGCATRFDDRMLLIRPDGEVIAPGPVPAGIVWIDHRLHLNDEPQSIPLDGGNHRIELLRSVRVRRVSGSTRTPLVEETIARFLVQQELKVSWQSDAGSQSLPQLVDGSDVTSFVLRAGEMGQLHIAAENEIVALVIHCGCDGPFGPLQVRRPGGELWNSEAPQPILGFVRAWRRTHKSTADWYLFALEEQNATLTLEVGPQGAQRCLRQVRAYGFP